MAVRAVAVRAAAGTAVVGDAAVVEPVAVAETAKDTDIAQVLQVFGELGYGLFLLCSTVP